MSVVGLIVNLLDETTCEGFSKKSPLFFRQISGTEYCVAAHARTRLFLLLSHSGSQICKSVLFCSPEEI